MEKIMTISQAADYGNISTVTIRRAIKSEQLPATKQVGQYGPEYHILLSDLEQWIAQNPRLRKDEGGTDRDSSTGSDQPDQGLICLSKETWEITQNQMQALAYRAGQAEGQLQILRDELDHVRVERNQEREQYLARIRDLENQVQEQQREVIEKLEDREKVFIEFVQTWREVATAREEKKKPWWMFWG